MDKKKLKNLLITLGSLLLLFIIGTAVYGQITTKAQQQAAEASAAAQESDALAEEEKSNTDALLAPDFSVLDRAGNTVRLSDYLGTPVVLNFWASWCPPCKVEMPYFQAMYETYAADEVIFLMVNFTGARGETIESATEYIEGEGYTFPIVFDTEMEAVQKYGVSGIPVTYFINREGYIVSGVGGSVTHEQLQASIKDIIQ